MARLDRLGTAKGIAQWGATLGRQFSYALLQAVSQREEVTLQRELGRLVEAELLYQRGVVPRPSTFQTCAYPGSRVSVIAAQHPTILPPTRGSRLTEQFPETAETHPELIAHHYTEAACNEQAYPIGMRRTTRH